MHTSKKMWLSLAAAFALALPSLSAFAGSPESKSSVRVVSGPALGELLGSSLPGAALAEIKAQAAFPVNTCGEVRGAAPAPGRDLFPRIEDPVRVRAILKLLRDIYNGVHLPYSQDGSTFTNREGRLPAKPLGFYKEYTLLTGNAPHVVVIGGVTYQVAPDLGARGSERVVIGGGEKVYYTPDHYAHFIQLDMVN